MTAGPHVRRRWTALAAIPFLVTACSRDLPYGQDALEYIPTTPVPVESPPPPTDVDDTLGTTPGPALDEEAWTPQIVRTGPPEADPLPDVDSGEGPLQVSVEQAVLLALSHNRSLAAERLNPLIQSTFEDVERAVFDPTIFANAQYDEEARQQSDRATRALFAVEAEGWSAEAGIRQTLPTGTDIELSLSENLTASNRTQDQYGSRAGLTLTQALLRGASLEANLASIHQAEIATLQSAYELRGFAEALVAEVETTYWDLVLAQKQMDIFAESLAVAEQQRDETEKRVNVGQLAETELAAARAEVALREQGLIDARSTLEKTRLNLLQLMNPKSDAGWDRIVVPSTIPDPLDLPEDNVRDRVALALALRPELNQARLAAESDRLEVIATRNGLLPRLDFFITLGKSGYAAAFNQSVNDVSGPSYDFTAGFNFELPVGNRQASALHLGAIASRTQAIRSLENLAQLTALDVRTATLEVERAKRQIAASAATRALQEEVLRAAVAKFQVGNGTAFSVAQAQRDLLESRIAEIEAIVAHRQALIELYRVEGSLLKRRGIDAPGGDRVDVDL
ncbi:MAG: transporter [Rhodospirillaceae bacterium]|nr:transporter [Rhodospirillaceae bacterium]